MIFASEIENAIQDNFANCELTLERIRDIADRIRTLEHERDALILHMKPIFTNLLCCCTMNRTQFGSSNHKVPLIKYYRAITGAGLRESKDAVESILEYKNGY